MRLRKCEIRRKWGVKVVKEQEKGTITLRRLGVELSSIVVKLWVYTLGRQSHLKRRKMISIK